MRDMGRLFDSPQVERDQRDVHCKDGKSQHVHPIHMSWAEYDTAGQTKVSQDGNTL
jgi:hypothetical protein